MPNTATRVLRLLTNCVDPAREDLKPHVAWKQVLDT